MIQVRGAGYSCTGAVCDMNMSKIVTLMAYMYRTSLWIYGNVHQKPASERARRLFRVKCALFATCL